MSSPSGAIFSPCGAFRLHLWRHLGAGPRVAFLMLNPSKAGAEVNDPTVRKTIGFAERLGFGSIEVVNLFAYCATSPSDLKAAGWPVGEMNDAHIAVAAASTDAVICSWGSNAAGHPRVAEALRMVPPNKRFALRINADGTPAHPLMLPYTCKLIEYAR